MSDTEIKAVVVRFSDSVRIGDGWEPIEHYRGDDHMANSDCFAIGWLVRDDDRGVVVCLARNADGAFVCDGIFVPRGAILEILPISAPVGLTVETFSPAELDAIREREGQRLDAAHAQIAEREAQRPPAEET